MLALLGTIGFATVTWWWMNRDNDVAIVTASAEAVTESVPSGSSGRPRDQVESEMQGSVPEGRIPEGRTTAEPVTEPVASVPVRPKRAKAKAKVAEPAVGTLQATSSASDQSAPATGTLRVTGSAKAVRLVGEKGTFTAGAVPVGTYTIEAKFAEGDGFESKGDVTVRAGGTTIVHCDEAFNKSCTVR